MAIALESLGSWTLNECCPSVHYRGKDMINIPTGVFTYIHSRRTDINLAVSALIHVATEAIVNAAPNYPLPELFQNLIRFGPFFTIHVNNHGIIPSFRLVCRRQPILILTGAVRSSQFTISFPVIELRPCSILDMGTTSGYYLYLNPLTPWSGMIILFSVMRKLLWKVIEVRLVYLLFPWVNERKSFCMCLSVEHVYKGLAGCRGTFPLPRYFVSG